MGQQFDALKARLSEIHNLNQVASLLWWDQDTQMPPGGAQARAAQVATVARIAHEMLTSDETARLLEAAADEVDGLPDDSDEASLVRVARHDYAEQSRLPADLVAAFKREITLAQAVWAEARANNDFAAFQPALERIVALTLERAARLGYADHPYDALLNQYERGMTTHEVKRIFEEHKPALVQLIADIRANADAVSDGILHQPFDLDRQRQFGLDVVQQFGYDMRRGRQDVALHPGCRPISIDDVRITTRFNPRWLNAALFGTMHEAGHAIYEQGFAPSLEGTPLANAASLGVHESQSRLWENIVGRSKGFWSWALPRLQAAFPDQLGDVDLDTFYKAINRVQPTFVRVEADEATYNLHIMLRFELETELVSGALNVRDLPRAWNARFEAYFGIAPPTDTLGVLQDIHWATGLIGYFPTYALGNLLAAQFTRHALEAHPSIPGEIASGQFDTLRGWLREHVHQHGRKFTSAELTQRVTGEAIQSRDFITYLTDKYSDIYGL